MTGFEPQISVVGGGQATTLNLPFSSQYFQICTNLADPAGILSQLIFFKLFPLYFTQSD